MNLRVSILTSLPFNRHPGDVDLVEAEVAAFRRFWQCTLGPALDIAVPNSDMGSSSEVIGDDWLPV